VPPEFIDDVRVQRGCLLSESAGSVTVGPLHLY
jgi:hypothetical protein